MSIKYFPNRVFLGSQAAIDRVMAERKIQVVRGHQDITASGLDVVVASPSGWQVDGIKLSFSGPSSRDYSVKVLDGVNVLQNLNDYLWFQVNGSLWQQITLVPNFYTGTDLATQLETQLDANAAFAALGRTFTVNYSDTTGRFTITPSSGQICYIQQNNTQRMPIRDSIAGHLFGLTQTTAFAANVVSDTAVYGLNQEAWIINEVASDVTQDYSDDIHILSLDQALHLESNTAAIIIDYEITYEGII